MEPECNPYFRESLNDLCWPVMARALRQYLTRIAEDDGAIIRDRSDPLDGLFRLLLPHADEAEAVRKALKLLVYEGFLLVDATSVSVRIVRPPSGFNRVRPQTPVPVSAPVKPSTVRVRKHRARLRPVKLCAVAPTVGAMTPSCSNGGVIEPLVEIKLFADLNSLSTSEPLATSAKSGRGGKQ
jgi:hypothetical protein